MRFALAGSESIGYECLKALLEEKQEIVGVITDKTNSESKWKNARIKVLATQAGIKLYEPTDINDPDFLKVLRGLDPDIVFNIAFVQLYKAAILGIPRLGCINCHPGPLPKYGGSNGWVWAIINGESEYGVTFHYMKEKIDTGDIIGLERFPIEKDETGLSLLIKCYKYGGTLFRRTLRDILEGRVVCTPQNLRNRSYYYNRVPYGGMIDIKWNAGRICDFVRAMTFSPFPNPLSPPMVTYRDTKLVITKAKSLGGSVTGVRNPGRVVGISKEGVIMETGDGIVLLNLSEASRPSMDIIELCQSKGIAKGSILGS